MPLNSFYEASLLSKQDKDNTRKEKFRPISIMNIDANILNKTLEIKFNSKLKGSVTSIKCDSSLDLRMV